MSMFDFYTAVSDIPEGYTIYSVLNPHVIVAFGDCFLTILHAMYLISNKVASDKVKIAVF